METKIEIKGERILDFYYQWIKTQLQIDANVANMFVILYNLNSDNMSVVSTACPQKSVES